MSNITRVLAIIFVVAGVSPALAQPRPLPPLPPAPPSWGLTADERAAVEDAMREVERQMAIVHDAMGAVPDVDAIVRDAVRDAGRGVREAQRYIEGSIRTAPRRDARWMARSWAESAQSRRGPEQVENIQKSFNIGSNGLLDIANIAGDIQIKAGGNTVDVQAIKRSRGEDAKGQLAAVEVRMTERPGRLEVRVIYPRGRNNINVSVDFIVTAPSGSSVAAKSVSGDVHVNDITGEVTAESVSGTVSSMGTPQATVLKSVSGDVEVSAVTRTGELRVASVSGDVGVRDSQVRGLEAESVSGNVLLRNITAERVGAKTVTGNVDFRGPLSQGGRYEMKSHSGEIQVGIANNAGFELEATTFSGSVRSDFPVTLGGPGRDVMRTGRGRQSMRGVHGDGSAVLMLSSFSGSITVTK
jgi:DUF4097 and DUF4098 domain-containing protein YvlB